MATAKKAAAKKPAAKKQGTSVEAAQIRKLKFAEAYIANGGNATEAAKTAGYSAATACSQGSRLLRDVEVTNRLKKVGEQLAKRYELTVEKVERSIAVEMDFDPGCLYRDDGSLKDITEMTEDQRLALASVEFTTEGTARDGFTQVRKIKWAAKAPAREQAMKYLGMFERDNVQKSPLTGLEPGLLESARDQLSALIAAQKKAAA